MKGSCEMPDKFQFTLGSITVIIDVVELTIVFLTCMLFMISRRYIFHKFEINCALTDRDKRKFIIGNSLITAIVITMAVIIPIEIIIDGRARWPWI